MKARGIDMCWTLGDDLTDTLITRRDFFASGANLQLRYLTPTPEPTSLILLGVGSMMVFRRHRAG